MAQALLNELPKSLNCQHFTKKSTNYLKQPPRKVPQTSKNSRFGTLVPALVTLHVGLTGMMGASWLEPRRFFPAQCDSNRPSDKHELSKSFPARNLGQCPSLLA